MTYHFRWEDYETTAHCRKRIKERLGDPDVFQQTLETMVERTSPRQEGMENIHIYHSDQTNVRVVVDTKNKKFVTVYINPEVYEALLENDDPQYEADVRKALAQADYRRANRRLETVDIESLNQFLNDQMFNPKELIKLKQQVDSLL